MPKIEKELKLTRVNVNFPTPLVERVKEYSLKLGVPTTQGYILLLTKALDNENILEQLPMLSELYKEFKSKELDNKLLGSGAPPIDGRAHENARNEFQRNEVY